MNRTVKMEVVDRLTKQLSGATNLYLTSFTGVGVQSMTQLRRELRATGGEYVVVKNTLALRALEAASVTVFDVELLAGPTAIIFTGEDPIAALNLHTTAICAG